MSPVLSFFAVVTCPVYLNDIARKGGFCLVQGFKRLARYQVVPGEHAVLQRHVAVGRALLGQG